MASDEPRAQQGVGGTSHSTDPDHLAWIGDYQSKTEHLRGMCLSACHDMLERFPDLKLVRGHVINPKGISLLDDVYLDPGDGHWWLETQDGKIVDPTKAQFIEDDGVELKYIAFDETKSNELPTGKCPEDGWYCYRGNFFCSWRCEVSYMAYMAREGAVFDRQEYKSICPNPECGCKSTKPVPNSCPYCETAMVELPVPDGGDLANGDAERDQGSHGR